MPVRVRLNDGINLVVRAEVAEFQKAYQDALKHRKLLEVENGDGKTRVINPVQILYFEDATGVTGEADRDPAEIPLPG